MWFRMWQEGVSETFPQWKAPWAGRRSGSPSRTERRASIPSGGNSLSKDPVGKCGAALETRKEPSIPGAWVDFRG